MTTRTALYRHFGRAGELLYIGISLSPVYRLAQHVEVASWASEIELVKIQYFETRGDAFTAERVAILAEKPKHNVIHNTANDNRLARGDHAELTARRKMTRASMIF